MAKNASFSMLIKQEICQRKYVKPDQEYLLLAFVLNDKSIISYLNQNEPNPWVISVYFDFIAQKIFEISQECFGKNNVHIKKHTNKNQIIIEKQTNQDLGNFQKILAKKTYLIKANLASFLSGVFLACGSLSNLDNPNYHLEIQCNNQVFFNAVQTAFEVCQFSTKTMTRRNKLVIYFKKAEMISDFLKLIQVSSCALEFENQRIQRGFNNQIQKANNFDVINLSRTIKTNNQQIHRIKELMANNQLHCYSQNFQDFCLLRLKHPTVSLTQLAYLYQDKFGKKITRSGINYFVEKLKKIGTNSNSSSPH